MPADETTALRDLDHLLPAFRASVVKGVRAYHSEYTKTAHRHRMTTRRSITRDEIVYDLRGELDGRPDVRVLDKNQTTLFVVGTKYRILIKKSDETGLVELAKTRNSLDFQCNEVQGDLFDEPPTNLYLSYIPDPNDPEEPTVLLICPNAAGYEWVVELQPPAAEISGEIGTAPTPSDEDDLVRIPEKAKPEVSE